MSKKLLLADDSITIQKVIQITFAHEDYELTITDNGDAALAKGSGAQARFDYERRLHAGKEWL